MSKGIWLNRSLIVSPIRMALCKNEKQFTQELKRLKIKESEFPDFVSCGADATTHFFRKGAEECCIVCLRTAKKITRVQVYSLLVHEAVHIWQAVKECIGEADPSKEFEAYSIQAISQELMGAY